MTGQKISAPSSNSPSVVSFITPANGHGLIFASSRAIFSETSEVVRSRSREFGTSFIPLMVSRMMLSLKKASRGKESGWTTDALSMPLDFERPSIDPQESDSTAASEEMMRSDLEDTDIPRVKWRRGDLETM